MRNSKTLEFMNSILKESEIPNKKKVLKEWDSSKILDAAFSAAEVIGEDPDWYDVVEEIVDVLPKAKWNKFLKDNETTEEEFWDTLEEYDIDSIISNLESYLSPVQVDKIVRRYEDIANEDEEEFEESEKLTEARNPENDEANELIRTSLNDPEYAKTHTAELRKHGIKYLKPNKDWGDNGALEGKQGRRLAINTDPKWSKNNVDYNTGRYMNDDAVYKKDYSREDTYADQKDLRQKGYVDSKEEYNKAKNSIKRQRTKVSNMEKKDKEAGINWNEKTSKARDTLKHYEDVLKKGIEPNYKNTKKIHPDTDLKGFLNAKKHSDRELPLEKQPDYNKGRNKTVTQFNNLKAEKNYLDHERERNKEEDRKDQERIEYYKQRAAEDKARRDEYLANNEKEWQKGQDELNQKLINYRKRMENK